jgi:hypothetical protein
LQTHACGRWPMQAPGELLSLEWSKMTALRCSYRLMLIINEILT